MPVSGNIGGGWRESNPLGDVGGSQRTSFAHVNVNGVWRPCKKPIPASYVYHTAYVGSNSDTVTTYYFTPTTSDWYKIICIGGSGNGNPAGSAGAAGQNTPSGGGGGSGGVAISQYWLIAGVSYTIRLGRTSVFVHPEGEMVATPGAHATSPFLEGGAGGSASGGNIVNLSGFSGGNGGASGWMTGTDGRNGNVGIPGGNDGMRGGNRGTSGSTEQPAGGGGGGGARLPGQGYCNYVVAFSLSGYAAGGGGHQADPNSNNATPYPAVIAGPDMKLYGGGGGGGGYGYFYGSFGGAHSLGSPEAVIIEKGVY